MRIFSVPTGQLPARAGSMKPAWFAVLLVAVVVAGPGEAGAQHPGELQGRVVDAVLGVPVPGARILIPAQGAATVADGDGSVHLRGLEPGRAEVHVQRFGYHPKRLTVRIRNGVVTRLDVALTPLALPGEPVRVRVRPGGDGVLDREAILRSGARTLGDALAGVAGVTVVRRGFGAAQEIRLRGGGGDQVLVLVDGIPINDPLTGTADLSGVAAGDVERIEVLPGALSARFGPGALAGVVLVETRPRGASVESALRTGSLGERGVELGLDRGSEVRGLHLAAGVSRVQGGFPFVRDEDLGGGQAHRSNADLTEVRARASVRGALAGGRTALHVHGEELERGIPGRSFAPSDSARQRQSALTALARWDWARWGAEGEGVALSGAAHHRLRRVRFSDPAPPLGVPFDHWSRMTETGAQLRAELRPEGEPEHLRLAAHLEGNRQALAGDALDSDVPLIHTDVALAVEAEGSPPGLRPDVRVAAAARAHRDGRSGRWLGAHDLTVRLAIGPALVHAAHRSSFSPPSAGDLFFREGVGIRPNPELRPERVPRELEVGASVRFPVGPATGELSGELFKGDLQDMIVWAPDFRFVWSPRNVDVRRHGGALRGRVRIPGWGLEAAAHLSDVRVTYRSGGGVAGSQVVYRPRLGGGGSLGWSSGGWHARLAATYTGLRYPVPAPVNALPSFWTVDLALGGALSHGSWRLEPVLRVDRLFDETARFIHAYPEPGRTLSLEIRARAGS